MPSQKDRLYVALYARGGQARMPGLEDTYHWALIIGPKEEMEDSQGDRFHAKEISTYVDGRPQSIWVFEERRMTMTPTAMILIRVLIGKVKNNQRIKGIMRGVPMRGDQPGWNCVGWVQEALELLHRDGRVLGTSITSWELIRDSAMRYVDRKKREHRFDGQGVFDTSRVATWDMLEGQELIH